MTKPYVRHEIVDGAITGAKIEDGTINAARIGTLDLDELGPYAKYQYNLLQRRMEAAKEFERIFNHRHPWISRIKGWPIIWSWYWRKRLSYILDRAGV